MENKKLLFFDIDGTLITDDGRRYMPESTRKALKEAKENGCLLFINTGRVFCNVEDDIKEGFDGLVCGCGTYIVFRDELLLHHKQTKETCLEIAKLCRNMNLEAVFEYFDRSCYDKEVDMHYSDELIEYFRREGRKVVDDINSPEFIFDKLTAFFDEKSDLIGFRKSIEKDWTYIDRGEEYVEIEPKGFSKASGIKFLLDYFKIPEENAYVFGDSNNDLEMMSFVKNSVAMGNGSDLCKKAASYVTDSVDEDGIFKAMQHFKLI